MERGLGKYKEKIHLKCFNYGRVGNFSSKCPYKRGENEEKQKEVKGMSKL